MLPDRFRAARGNGPGAASGLAVGPRRWPRNFRRIPRGQRRRSLAGTALLAGGFFCCSPCRTGFLVILLSRFILESPRFLLHIGRVAEAENTLARFNIKLVRTAVVEQREVAKHSIKVNCSGQTAFGDHAGGLHLWRGMGVGELGICPHVTDHHAGLFATRREDRERIAFAKSALIAVPGCPGRFVVVCGSGAANARWFWLPLAIVVLRGCRIRQPSKVDLNSTNFFSVC